MKLFSHRFKIAGIILVIASYLIPIGIGMLNKQPWEATSLRRAVAQAAILVGFAFITLSREKIEDEFIFHCRLKAATAAFVFGIVFYIITAFMALTNQDEVYSAFRVLISEAIFYLIMFHWYVRGEKAVHE